MTQRSILITGCSSGIGLHCARGLRDDGWRVFASARKPDDVRRLRSEPGLGEAVQLDLDDPASIERGLDDVLERTGGRLDALFNNAAFGQPGAVEDLERDVLRAQFETNLFGTHDLTRRVIPVMRRQGHGRIVQHSSMLGLVSLPFRGAYNASKYALEGLSDTLRLELHGSGIHVSLIDTGPVRSRFRANAFARYQANIDREHSHFRDVYAGMEARLRKHGPAAPFTLPPEAVLKKLRHALNHPRPRARYYVTFPAWLFAILRRWLPDRGLDAVLRRVAARENRP